MTTEPRLFAPEMEELLREVAADPRSCLLRIPRPKTVRVLYDRNPAISALAAGLTSAERELVRVHRAEVAHLLRQMCIRLLMEHPRLANRFTSFVTPTRRLELLSDEERRTRVERALTWIPREDVEPTVFDLLEACVRSAPGHQPSVSELAAASMTLEPTDQARIYTGLDLLGNADFATGARVLSAVLEGTPSPLNRSLAWEDLGLGREKQGDLAAALEAHFTAIGCAEDRVEPLMSTFSLAIQTDNATAALSAAQGIDDRLKSGDACVDSYVSRMLAHRKQGEWTVTPNAHSCLTRIRDRLGETSRKVAHVLE